MKFFRARKSVDDETIEAMAAAWLAQRDEGLTPEEAVEFARWRQAAPRHEAAVVRLEATWAKLQELREFRPEARRHPDRDLLTALNRRKSAMGPLLAATGLAAAVVAFVLWSRPGPAEPREAPAARIYATTVEGYQRVTLEDGSLIELNASSEVQVEFTPAERRLFLKRGEAHFTVAKNKARPFLVRAGTVAVRAVGTEFNVRLAERQVEVLVTEGRVKVEPPANAAVVATELPTLGAGQRAFIAAPAAVRTAPVAPMVVESLSSEAIRDLLSWQGPRLVFVDAPLSEVIEQFNRRNQVQIVLGDRELGAQTVGGSFRTENVDAFVRLMTSGKEMVAEHPDPKHVVLRRAR